MNNNIYNIILTRSDERSKSLKSKLETLDYNVISLPCLEVELLAKNETEKINLSEFQIIIFVSVNAVRGFFNNYVIGSLNDFIQVMAIGSATAQALRDYQVKNVTHPSSEFEQQSEYFVNLPELQNIYGKNILIVRGDKSREYIPNVLAQQGAKITEMIVYTVTAPKFLKNDLLLQLRFLLEQRHNFTHRIDSTAILITSVSTLQNLVDNLNLELLDILQGCHLIVVSSRIAAVAKQLGFYNIINSNTMNEDCIIKLINDIK